MRPSASTPSITSCSVIEDSQHLLASLSLSLSLLLPSFLPCSLPPASALSLLQLLNYSSLWNLHHPKQPSSSPPRAASRSASPREERLAASRRDAPPGVPFSSGPAEPLPGLGCSWGCGPGDRGVLGDHGERRTAVGGERTGAEVAAVDLLQTVRKGPESPAARLH